MPQTREESVQVEQSERIRRILKTPEMVLTPLQNAGKQFGRFNLDASDRKVLEEIYSGNGRNGKAIKS